MKSKKIFVKGLNANTSYYDELFCVEEIQKHSTKTGEPYYRLTLTDKTGKMSARIWKDDLAKCNVGNLQPGTIVEVDFDTSLYNSEMQAIVRRLCEVQEYDVSDFMISSKKDLDTMWNEIEGHINDIQDPNIKALLNNIFADETIKKLYRSSSAAEDVHHDFVGGLMEHVLEMISIGLSMVEHYPMANKDIIVSAIILHDIGKIYELEQKNNITSRSKIGYLLGHIMIGVELVLNKLPEGFPDDLKVHLLHIILSHHGELEFGAPVRPATIEAGIVHVADKASSTVRQFEKEISSGEIDDIGFGRYQKFLKTRIFVGQTASEQVPQTDSDTINPPEAPKVNKSENEAEDALPTEQTAMPF